MKKTGESFETFVDILTYKVKACRMRTVERNGVEGGPPPSISLSEINRILNAEYGNDYVRGPMHSPSFFENETNQDAFTNQVHSDLGTQAVKRSEFGSPTWDLSNSSRSTPPNTILDELVEATIFSPSAFATSQSPERYTIGSSSKEQSNVNHGAVSSTQDKLNPISTTRPLCTNQTTYADGASSNFLTGRDLIKLTGRQIHSGFQAQCVANTGNVLSSREKKNYILSSTQSLPSSQRTFVGGTVFTPHAFFAAKSTAKPVEKKDSTDIVLIEIEDSDDEQKPTPVIKQEVKLSDKQHDPAQRTESRFRKTSNDESNPRRVPEKRKYNKNKLPTSQRLTNRTKRDDYAYLQRGVSPDHHGYHCNYYDQNRLDKKEIAGWPSTVINRSMNVQMTETLSTTTMPTVSSSHVNQSNFEMHRMEIYRERIPNRDQWNVSLNGGSQSSLDGHLYTNMHQLGNNFSPLGNVNGHVYGQRVKLYDRRNSCSEREPSAVQTVHQNINCQNYSNQDPAVAQNKEKGYCYYNIKLNNATPLSQRNSKVNGVNWSGDAEQPTLFIEPFHLQNSPYYTPASDEPKSNLESMHAISFTNDGISQNHFHKSMHSDDVVSPENMKQEYAPQPIQYQPVNQNNDLINSFEHQYASAMMADIDIKSPSGNAELFPVQTNQDTYNRNNCGHTNQSSEETENNQFSCSESGLVGENANIKQNSDHNSSKPIADVPCQDHASPEQSITVKEVNEFLDEVMCSNKDSYSLNNGEQENLLENSAVQNDYFNNSNSTLFDTIISSTTEHSSKSTVDSEPNQYVIEWNGDIEPVQNGQDLTLQLPTICTEEKDLNSSPSQSARHQERSFFPTPVFQAEPHNTVMQSAHLNAISLSPNKSESKPIQQPMNSGSYKLTPTMCTEDKYFNYSSSERVHRQDSNFFQTPVFQAEGHNTMTQSAHLNAISVLPNKFEYKTIQQLMSSETCKLTNERRSSPESKEVKGDFPEPSTTTCQVPSPVESFTEFQGQENTDDSFPTTKLCSPSFKSSSVPEEPKTFESLQKQLNNNSAEEPLLALTQVWQNTQQLKTESREINAESDESKSRSSEDISIIEHDGNELQAMKVVIKHEDSHSTEFEILSSTSPPDEWEAVKVEKESDSNELDLGPSESIENTDEIRIISPLSYNGYPANEQLEMMSEKTGFASAFSPKTPKTENSLNDEIIFIGEKKMTNSREYLTIDETLDSHFRVPSLAELLSRGIVKKETSRELGEGNVSKSEINDSASVDAVQDVSQNTMSVQAGTVLHADKVLRIGKAFGKVEQKLHCSDKLRKEMQSWEDIYKGFLCVEKDEFYTLTEEKTNQKFECKDLWNTNRGVIMMFESNLQKQDQIIEVVKLLKSKDASGPHFIIVPSRLIPSWAEALHKLAPELLKVVYEGSTENRRQLATKLKTEKFNVLLTNFECASRDNALLSQIEWTCMIVDERFRFKNQSCKLTKVLILKYKTKFRFLLTEQSMQENLPDTWSHVNYLAPEINSGESFEKFFNADEKGRLKLNRKEIHAVVKCLHLIMKPFIKKITDHKNTEKVLESVLHTIKCDMSYIQRTLYMNAKSGESLIRKSFTLYHVAELKTKRKVDKVSQLRKICNHPFIFEEVEEEYAASKQVAKTELSSSDLCRASGKFEFVNRLLPKLVAKRHRVLIYCQLEIAMCVLEDYLILSGQGYVRIDRSTRGRDFQRRMREFENENSQYTVFLLSSKKVLGDLDLQRVHTVLLLDSDWTSSLKLNVSNTTRVLRLVVDNSVEERFLSTLDVPDPPKCGKSIKEQCLALEEKDEVRQEEIKSDDAINSLVARDKDEFDLFQRMDREQSTVQPCSRLIEQHEVPWLLPNTEKDEKNLEEAIDWNLTFRKRNNREMSWSVEGAASTEGNNPKRKRKSKSEASAHSKTKNSYSVKKNDDLKMTLKKRAC